MGTPSEAQVSFLRMLSYRNRGVVLERSGAEAAVIVFEVREAMRHTLTEISWEIFEWARSEGFLGQGQDESFRLTVEGRSQARRSTLGGEGMAASASVAMPPHDGRQSTIASSRSVLRNDAESPLAWLHRRLDKDGRPMIGASQFEAGERLRGDLWLAEMTPRVTSSWSGIPSSRARTPGMTMSETRLAAKQRVVRALDAVGPELAGILIDVCGHLVGLEAVERAHGWPQRSAKLVLGKALTALARHYGIIAPEKAEALVSRKLRMWAAADYKPHLGRWRGA